MQIQIDKNVPLPKLGNATKKYPLSTMEPGDSFFVPEGNAIIISRGFIRYRPKKFSVRTVIEDGVKGVRVWRVE